MATVTAGEQFGELQRNWGWMLAFGALSIFFGIIGLGMTMALTLTSVFVFGVLLLVNGVGQLIQTFWCRGWKSILWSVLIGILYVLAGVDIMSNPVASSFMLTLLLAGFLMGIGGLRIVMGFQHRPASGWWWPLIGGILSIALGLMIMARWPSSGLFTIGLFVAIELISHGWSMIWIALAAKNASTGQPTAQTVHA